MKCCFLQICALLLCSFLQGQALEYVENKGQWHPAVKYKGQLQNGALFLQESGYTVLQYHPEDFAAAIGHATGHSSLYTNTKFAGGHAISTVPFSGNVAVSKDPLSVRSHAYRVNFQQANAHPQLVPERVLPGYQNYFIGNDAARWVSNVRGYETVLYKNVYRGIDVRYYSDNGFVKYDIIVQPYGDIRQLGLLYSGVNSLQVKDGDLYVATSVGEIREREPYSYQLEEGVRKKVQCRYVVSNHSVRFKLTGYDPSKVLVIDPTFVFSTFAGSSADNWGYTATYDRQGNAYGGGIVFGSGYPVTTGAFQVSFGGGTTGGGSEGAFDMAVTKLSPNGTARIYSTYIGGSGNEQPHSLIADGAGNLVIAGRTQSPNYPVTQGGTMGPGGGWDIVVTKLNAAGTALIGSVKIGGTLDDGVNMRHKFPDPQPEGTNQNYGDDARSEVILDGAGNVLVATCTRSTNFPLTNGAFQQTLGGEQDGLLLKFSPNLGNLIFATLIGGSGLEAAYVLTEERGGTILMAGGTTSANFPGDKAGTVGTAYAGGLIDGFIARVSSDGSTLLKSAFIGTPGMDQLYGIQKDTSGNIYVMGTSTGNFGIRNAAFSQAGGKQFIAKLLPDFSAYVYSTVFGPNTTFPNISPTAFLVDRCENVYVSGWGGNIIVNAPYPIAPTNGLPVTPDAIRTNTDGRDFYFFVLEKNAASQLYGSFFGQTDGAGNAGSHDHVDGGTSRFDEDGIIYQAMCANCNGGQFPTTPGVVSPNNPSSRCNLAVVKINFDLSGVRTGMQSFIDGIVRDSSGCVPVTVEFVDTVALGQRFEWSFGDGSPVETTTTPRANHTFNNEGNYRVRLIAIDEDKCIPRDTAFINIRVRIDRVVLDARASLLPPCADLNYRFDNLTVPFPGKPFRANSFTWIFGDNSAPLITGPGPVTHRYPGPGTYNVQLIMTDTNYCNAPDTLPLTVRVSPTVRAGFNQPLTGCAPFLATFSNTSEGGATFFWDFGNGQTSTAINPSVLYSQPGTYTVKLVASDPGTCNQFDSTTFSITVSGSPNALFTYSPNPSMENIVTTFFNQSGPAARYTWLFGDGDTLLTLRRDTVVRHQYPRTDIYNACLVAMNEFGCADTFCLPVPSIVTAVIDVVSAFTPNGDGVNDRAVVYGFGVAKMVFRIYNRWGQLVFESSDPQFGWDGIFKGKPQPMEAYGYTLDAELVDGQKVKKSGSITLIR